MYILTMYDDIYSFEDCSKGEIMNKVEVENKSVFLIQLSSVYLNLIAKAPPRGQPS